MDRVKKLKLRELFNEDAFEVYNVEYDGEVLEEILNHFDNIVGGHVLKIIDTLINEENLMSLEEILDRGEDEEELVTATFSAYKEIKEKYLFEFVSKLKNDPEIEMYMTMAEEIIISSVITHSITDTSFNFMDIAFDGYFQIQNRINELGKDEKMSSSYNQELSSMFDSIS